MLGKSRFNPARPEHDRPGVVPAAPDRARTKPLPNSTSIDAVGLTAASCSIYALLSPKERSVLVAAARGAEDKEIAATLGCTLSTVRTLWQRTYKKTRTSSRRQLIAALWGEACRVASLSFIERHDNRTRVSEPLARQGSPQSERFG